MAAPHDCIAVAADPASPELLDRARRLGDELQLPFSAAPPGTVPISRWYAKWGLAPSPPGGQPPSSKTSRCEVFRNGDSPPPAALLVVTPERLELRDADAKASGPVYVEFVRGRAGFRGRAGGLAGQLIARAIGWKGKGTPHAKQRVWGPHKALRVVDATAGFGADAFVLASLGCVVTAVERSPVMAALLEDGLQRAAREPALAPVCQRLQLVRSDARLYLQTLVEQDRPEVIYTDPMFPHRAKSAASRKEMRLCRIAAGDDEDAGELLAVARRVARQRVVVKRRLHAPTLAGKPDVVYRGRAIRYDVYLTRTGRQSDGEAERRREGVME